MQTEVYLKGDIENTLRSIACTVLRGDGATDFQHGFGMALTAVAAAVGLPNPERFHAECVDSIMKLWPELSGPVVMENKR